MATPIQWQITETNASERRNLFSLTPGQETHLATIISGSRSKLDEFDHCVKLIECIPEMFQAILRAQKTLNEIAFLENSAVRTTRLLLDDLVSRLGE